MSLSIHCNPVIYINNKEIGFSSFNITESGNNQINTCQIKTNYSFHDSYKLFNEEVRIYLNRYDGSPIFRGFIKTTVPSEKEINITAHDPRSLLTGADGIPINLTEKNNYDGYTISQFLIHYINTYVNKDKEYIGVDYISDSNISMNMKNIRGHQTDIYSMCSAAFQNALNDTDIDDLHGYSLGIIDDGEKAQIIINRELAISSTPSLTLSYLDGIKNLQYTRRMAPSYGINFTKDGKEGNYQHGNMPYGRINETGGSSFDNTADATYAAMVNILKQQEDKDEIIVGTTKGFEISIGSIVRLNIDDYDIRGNHRVASKRISFNKGDMVCSLGLNRKPVALKTYI